MMAVRAHLVIRGRVQGVWYRGSMENEAERLGVAGWVRNRPDGSVEVAAEGADASIHALQAALKQGPDGARVSAVDELPLESQPLERPFTILR